jgi:hypothetical protein
LLHRELLLPTDEFFPVVWSPDVAGASRMVRRLMAYCGLHDVVFIVVQLPRDEDDRPIISHRTDGASLVFEVNPSQLDHPEIVASAAWREVVEVWCERQLGDAREDVDVEFASVFLGGGVLLANGALTQRVRREGLATVQETFSSGGLIGAASVFLLGVALRARAKRGEWDKVLPHLEETQRRCLVEMESSLELGETYRRWLHIHAYGGPDTLANSPVPKAEVVVVVPPEAAATWAVRVARKQWGLGVLVGVIPGALGLFRFGAWFPAVTVGLGLAWAALRRVDECCQCRITVEPAEERCVGCGALLVGRLVNGEKVVEPRFAAEVKRISEAMRANEEELERLATTGE